MADILHDENIRLPPKWIELNLSKRECSTFIAVPNDITLCQCGRRKIDHGDFVKHQHRPEHWSPNNHTRLFSTDAYGTILFEGEHHHNKAHYVRLSYDTNPHLVLQLMRYVWGYQMPKLIISIRGGSTNFDLSTRLGKIFQSGIIKAAKSTSAWVFSGGLNTGVTKHLGTALGNERWIGEMRRGHIVSVGIAPWGMCEHRDELIGRNKERVYSPLEHVGSKFLHLNPRHSNFFLVDNGSIGKFGGENYLRHRLEKCISSYPSSPHHGCGIPVVVVVLEGGFHTLRMITEYLYDDPPIPVVVFAGTGRSADLVAWIIKRFKTEGELEIYKDDVLRRIANIFKLGENECMVVYKELKGIWKRKILITVYNPNSTSIEEEFDTVILASIFRSQHWSPLQQLSLSLVWDRVDIAQAEVFVYGREWSRDHLEQAMMEALVSNRLDFVNLLLEHGLNMQTFLTASRLETLYSIEHLRCKTLISLLMEFSRLGRYRSNRRGFKDHNLTLHDVGVVLSHMMGHIYRSNYVHLITKIHEGSGASMEDQEVRGQVFSQPFDDLFLWAVLTKRHELAKLLWLHGHGALAKALVAVKLNKFMAKELSKMMTTLVDEFESNAEEWENLSLTLLDTCYRQDFKMARLLLTMELQCWSQQTCLTLAVMANHRMLLGHPCSQILLADLWMGALNMKSNVSLKIICGILCPPLVCCLEYKSTEELRLLPHQEKDLQHHQMLDDRDIEDDTEIVKDFGHIPDMDVKIPDSESIRTYDNVKSQGSLMSVFRNRPQKPKPPNARVTDLSLVVSRLDFGRSSGALNSNRMSPMKPMPLIPPAEGEDLSTKMFHLDQLQPQPQQKLKQKQVALDPKKEKATASSHQTPTPGVDSKPKILGIRRPKVFSSFITTQQSLTPFQKFVAFQRAPVTNFLRHMIAYLFFIVALAYVILYPQNPRHPGWVEWYVIAVLSSMGLECIREFIFIDALSCSKKIVRLAERFWTLMDFLVVIFFMIGVGLRMQLRYFEYGMLIYRSSSIYWNMRLYKYLGVHRFVGPKIVMMSRMLSHMACFSMIILVVIVSFGVAREAIRYPDQHPTWSDLAEAFLEPYTMMFGEVEQESLIPQCKANGTENASSCPLGIWLVPFFWVMYMMVSNILIVNVLIAVFNGIYAEIDAQAVEVWMFQRFTFVMEFEQKPLLPPPFIVICHVLLVLGFIWNKFIKCVCEEELLETNLNEDDKLLHIIQENDHNLKSFLSPAEQHMLFDFEEESLDMLRPLIFGREQSHQSSSSRGSSLGNAEVMDAYRSASSSMSNSDKSSMQQLKSIIQDIYGEMESQRAKIDKLIEYWEMDLETKGEDDEDNETRRVSEEPIMGISAISTSSSISRQTYQTPTLKK